MTNAILMASGLGTRMRPLTDTTPKPLIKVGDKPMIETVIDALIKASVKDIYVVVGYLGEQFKYLTEKYNNVTIIKNPDYETVNNISSIYYAKDVLNKSDCFICEADLFVSDIDIFKSVPNFSCYFGKMVDGFSDDWVFDLNDNGYISRVGKNGKNRYNMVGLSYFTKDDAAILSQAIEKAYHKQGYEDMFWDEVVDKNLDVLKLKIYPVKENQIVEIDTVDELNYVLNKNKKIKRRKYDYFFSVGESCACASSLKLSGLRLLSGPFDWNWGANCVERLNIIINQFKNWSDKEYLEPLNDPTSLNEIYINTKTKVRFNHDFPRNVDFEKAYLDFSSRCERRINRFMHILKNKKTLLVYIECAHVKQVENFETNNFEEVKSFFNDLRKIFPKVDLLFIRHNENLNNKQFLFEEITENIFYAECFNYYKDNILTANNCNHENICNILSMFKLKFSLKRFVTNFQNKIIPIFYKNKAEYVRIWFLKFYKKKNKKKVS